MHTLFSSITESFASLKVVHKWFESGSEVVHSLKYDGTVALNMKFKLGIELHCVLAYPVHNRFEKAPFPANYKNIQISSNGKLTRDENQLCLRPKRIRPTK